MKKKIVLFILSYVIWILLNWVPDWEHLLVGALISVFVTYITGDLFVYSPRIYADPRRLMRFVFFYLPLLVIGMVKASLIVTYRILHPALPVHPGIIKVRTSLKTDTALTYLANTITLTGGTLTVDIDQEKGILYVHCIDVKTRDVESTTKLIAERYETLLREILE